ncbi:MAG: thiamine phosphate synthase [Acidobacteriaceae bacterium]
MLYAITNRRLYAENDADARARLVELAAVWAANGVSFIQLREKDLSARDLVELARAMLRAIHSATPRGVAVPRLLVNGRVDVALAAGAEGVHLPVGPDALTPQEVRSVFAAAGRSQPPVISVACHKLQEIEVARQQSPNCILFAPVFEKAISANEIAGGARPNPDSAQKLPGVGLSLLQQACCAAAPVPVFALGGVTADNAADCLRAGAAGIAAIRLLQEPPSVWRGFA